MINMTVSREEFYNTRARLLKDMDKAVRDTVQTIEVFDMWLMCGVPDGADDTDFREIAEDDELWLDCVNTFAKVMNRG
jgi:methionine synthase II (cobalamin-independent)